jgi:hypothetical protein
MRKPMNTASRAFNDIIDERIGTHASAVSAAKAASTASSRALSDMIDERVEISKKKSTPSAETIASKVPKVADEIKTATAEAPMTKREMTEMLDRIDATKTAKAASTKREMNSMIDERFHQLNSSNATKTSSPVRTASHNDVPFNNKSKEQQRQLVGDAVRQVMDSHEDAYDGHRSSRRYTRGDSF